MAYTDLRFYVYVHKYASGPKEGQVFYVGKGRYGRYLDKKSRSKHWHNIVNKYGFTYDILSRFNKEECAFSFEIALIKLIGIDNLCNNSSGGEGSSGSKWSEESKERLRIAKTGRLLSFEHREKIRTTTQSKEHKENLSKLLRSPSIRIKLSDSAKKQFATDEDKARHARSCGGKSVMRSDGVIYSTVSEAARKMTDILGKKCAGQNIDRACRVDGYTAFGYGWKFIVEGRCKP